MVDYARTKPIDDEKARVILQKITRWMKDGNHEFALGTDTYTLADVLLTTMMSRLCIDKTFFKAKVLENPVLNAYWKRVQARPSYKDAH